MAYTGPTRNYFRRRAWSILHDRGRLGGPEYVQMAEQVLRHFSDGDAVPVFARQQRRHGWGTTGDKAIDRFGTYYVFNRILYRNSPRYSPARGGFFVCKGNYTPGDPVLPQGRKRSPSSGTAPPRRSCACAGVALHPGPRVRREGLACQRRVLPGAGPRLGEAARGQRVSADRPARVWSWPSSGSTRRTPTPSWS